MTPTEILAASWKQLEKDFDKKIPVPRLLKDRSDVIDQVVTDLWDTHHLNEHSAGLIAVGGYGRGEMHPASDVDLLVLLPEAASLKIAEQLSAFVTALWDLGLEIGHSVRTLDECVDKAETDLTIITNLMEARHLCGDLRLFELLNARIGPDQIWDGEAFFDAKLEEQDQRYYRYGDTAYRVEPNLKDGPGGLRDIQMIDWILERNYNSRLLQDHDSQSLLTKKELRTMTEGLHFLWAVRFALHLETKRKEDRLLFDHQRSLAARFGFPEGRGNESVERFMQRYYRTITELERLNEVLLGVLRRRIKPNSARKSTPITNLYVNDNNYLDIVSPSVFAGHPHSLLEIFSVIQKTPELKGLTPDTIRALRHNLHLIDDDFRQNPRHQKLFVDILSEPSGITFVMRRMNRYGVLAAYIPAFANIVGRMQYDLFHAYTVDDHTLHLVSNIRFLSVQEGRDKYPFLSEIFETLNKPQLLYIAALFHDIAKGRKGSHSALGAADAEAFCQLHGYDEYDTHLVSWLVREHLTMSTTAQRKDISDPDVIRQFAERVAILQRLDYLYLLTVSDIRSTNPELLTDWKNSLLRELYHSTRQYLLQSETSTPTVQELVQGKKNSVLKRVQAAGIDSQKCAVFWASFSEEYFLQHSVDLLAWHLQSIVSHSGDLPIVQIKADEKRRSTQVLIYTGDSDTSFTRITAALERMQMNIVAANLAIDKRGCALDTLTFLDADGRPVSNSNDQKLIAKAIQDNLEKAEFSNDASHYRTPRRLKYFDIPTRVKFGHSDARNMTVLTLHTSDSPGLLSRVGEVFLNQGLRIHGARIATLGEQVEDIFYLTDDNNLPIIDDEHQQQITDALIHTLDARNS